MRRSPVIASLTAVFCLTLASLAAGATGLSSSPRATWVPNGTVRAVEVVGDKGYVAGAFDTVGQYTGGFPRIDRATGEPRSAWPEVAGLVTAAEPDGSGGWYVGGRFESVGGLPRANLAHILADGTVDPAFAPAVGHDNAVYPVRALLRIGTTLYIGGQFDSVDGQPRTALAAVDAVTGALSDFAPLLAGALTVEVAALAGRRVSGVTTLWAGGAFGSVDGQARTHVAGFTDGALNTFAPALNDHVYAIEPDGLTGIYLGGKFTTVNGESRTGVARVTGAAGTTTSAFYATVAGGGGDPQGAVVFDVERTSSSLYLGGDFETVRGHARPNLAAVDPVSGTVTGWTPAADPAAPNRYVHDVVVDEAAGKVYAGGPGLNVREYDAASGARSSFGPLLSDEVVLFVGLDGTDVLVGGGMTIVNGVPRPGFYEMDLATGRPTPFNLSVDGDIQDFAHRGHTLYVVGQFGSTQGANSSTRPGAASLDTRTGRWSAFGATGAPADSVFLHVAVGGTTVWLASHEQVRAYRDDPPGEETPVRIPEAEGWVSGGTAHIAGISAGPDALYIGGDFTSVRTMLAPLEDVSRSNLAAIGVDGAIRPWDPGTDGKVNAVQHLGGTVAAGGEFTQAGGLARDALAEFDATTGVPTPLQSTAEGWVSALHSYEDQLLVGRAQPPGLGAVVAGSGALGAWQPNIVEGPSGGLPSDMSVSRERGVLVGGGMIVGLGPVGTANLAHFAFVPPAPTDVSAVPGDAQATVSFRLPGDGGAPVTGYTVTASPGGATATGTGSPVVVGGLQNGTAYTFTVRATNEVGTGPDSAPSAPVTPGAAVGGGGGAADTTAPVLESLGAKPKRFRRRRGTRVSLRLSEAAKVRFDLLAPVRGRRVRGKCRRETRANRRRKACSLLVRRAGVTRSLPAGSSSFRFRAPKARPGRYRLRATPSDAAGNVGRARTVRVVLRR